MKAAIKEFHTPLSEPACCYAPDQPLSELGFAEQFLVWSLRVQWRVTAEGAGTKSHLLQRAFDALQMPEGPAIVAELAAVLALTVKRPLSIPCPRWRALTSDEVRLLNFVAALQRRDGQPGAALDPSWATAPCGASPIWVPAQRLALAFSAAGLVFGSASQGLSFPEAMPRLLH
ncbi:hypothetical protein [Parvibaculum sp.]|jgi:hypothetical protein|uniref:hypothetical protein n=1 Tax=Parvibaculum sp. TaxID=2024848 RepID=UPI00391C6208|nr:hypothetical protein [Parvibaculaceae bacterium]